MAYSDDLTETANVYRPHGNVLADLSYVPSACTLVKSQMKVNIHRGHPQAMSEAYALGIIATDAALVFADASDYGNLGDRYVLVDKNNDAWVIRGRPAKHDRFQDMAFVRCLATILLVRPDGVPS